MKAAQSVTPDPEPPYKKPEIRMRFARRRKKRHKKRRIARFWPWQKNSFHMYERPEGGQSKVKGRGWWMRGGIPRPIPHRYGLEKEA